MLTFTEDDVRRDLIATYVQRGLEYQARGYVKGLEISEDGHAIRARVQGTARAPYRVAVQITAGRKRRVSIRGNCTCPMAFNCKHVAAVLFEALATVGGLDAPADAGDTLASATAAPGGGDLVRDWLGRIERSAAPGGAVAPPARLLYLLHLDAQHRGAQVEIVAARRLRDGSFQPPQRLVGGLSGNARHLTADDREILRWLKAAESERPNSGYGAHRLDGDLGARALGMMLASGRCHWQHKDGPALTLGRSRHATPAWLSDAEGRQRLTFHGDASFDALLPLTPPWYVDLGRRECGPLDTGLPEAFAGALATAPSIEPAQAGSVRRALERIFPGNAAALPREFTEVTAEPVAPVTHLRLLHAALPQRDFRTGRVDTPLAHLSFDYRGVRVAATDPRRELTHVDGDRLLRIARHPKAEAKSRARLERAGFLPLANAGLFDTPPKDHAHDWILLDETREQALLDFSIRVLPELRAAGWQIEIDTDYPYRVATMGENWYADIDDTSSSDWFGLELGITVDGARVNLLPLLLDWLQRTGHNHAAIEAMDANDHALTHLPDGRLLPIPIARVRGVLETLTELYGDKPFDPNGRLRLSRLTVAELPALENALGAALEWRSGAKLLALGRKLRDFRGIAAVAPPKGLRAQLRAYQRDGLNWLQFLREYELAGVLADDMGLGKTVQTLAHLLAEKEAGRLTRPALVVAPTSLMTNWRRETERFAPALKTLTLHGSGRRDDFARIDAHDVVFTTYPLLPRDAEALLKHEFHLVILDEAQVIKNPKAKATDIVRALKTRHRLCLTGTPMENHLGELWSLFHFLMPGFLGDEREFRRLYRTPIEKHADAGRRAALARRVKPFLLRRTKEEVAAELPPKTEIVRAVELDGAQRDLYESIRLSLHSKVREEVEKRGLARSQIVILDALLKLRQACCDPRLLKLDSAQKVKQSAKLELLMDMLPELIEEGRRVLLFSQFTSMLALIEAELKSRRITYALLTGNTRDRATPIERFQSGAVPLFLVSLKAGGTGLNLTAADTVIHYDPWWNPAVERQATDRAHRIGQDKNVFVYKLITQGTVEEKITVLQARKQALADGLYGERGGEPASALTAEDLEALFAAPG
jgi:superfamily II DNA or RNA helicase